MKLTPIFRHKQIPSTGNLFNGSKKVKLENFTPTKKSNSTLDNELKIVLVLYHRFLIQMIIYNVHTTHTTPRLRRIYSNPNILNRAQNKRGCFPVPWVLSTSFFHSLKQYNHTFINLKNTKQLGSVVSDDQ